jgi:hypothetical protein
VIVVPTHVVFWSTQLSIVLLIPSCRPLVTCLLIRFVLENILPFNPYIRSIDVAP